MQSQEESQFRRYDLVYLDMGVSWQLQAYGCSNLDSYAALGDATCETKLHFQKEEVYIKMHTGWNIKYSHSDWGGEFLSQGTQRELTVHDSPHRMVYPNVECALAAEQAQLCLSALGYPTIYGKRWWSICPGCRIGLELATSWKNTLWSKTW